MVHAWKRTPHWRTPSADFYPKSVEQGLDQPQFSLQRVEKPTVAYEYPDDHAGKRGAQAWITPNLVGREQVFYAHPVIFK